jgi:hypothetical protein
MHIETTTWTQDLSPEKSKLKLGPSSSSESKHPEGKGSPRVHSGDGAGVKTWLEGDEVEHGRFSSDPRHVLPRNDRLLPTSEWEDRCGWYRALNDVGN